MPISWGLKASAHYVLRYLISISSPIGTDGKPLAAIGKFPSAICKLIFDKTLANNGEEINNALIGNDVLANYC